MIPGIVATADGGLAYKPELIEDELAQAQAPTNVAACSSASTNHPSLPGDQPQ